MFKTLREIGYNALLKKCKTKKGMNQDRWYNIVTRVYREADRAE
jgi:hypothetical protein